MHSSFVSAYRCCYCHYWNPARKQRPTAPKLEATRPPREVSTESSSSEEGISSKSRKFTLTALSKREFLTKNRSKIWIFALKPVFRSMWFSWFLKIFAFYNIIFGAKIQILKTQLGFKFWSENSNFRNIYILNFATKIQIFRPNFTYNF